MKGSLFLKQVYHYISWLKTLRRNKNICNQHRTVMGRRRYRETVIRKQIMVEVMVAMIITGRSVRRQQRLSCLQSTTLGSSSCAITGSKHDWGNDINPCFSVLSSNKSNSRGWSYITKCPSRIFPHISFSIKQKTHTALSPRVLFIYLLVYLWFI